MRQGINGLKSLLRNKALRILFSKGLQFSFIRIVFCRCFPPKRLDGKPTSTGIFYSSPPTSKQQRLMAYSIGQEIVSLGIVLEVIHHFGFGRGLFLCLKRNTILFKIKRAQASSKQRHDAASIHFSGSWNKAPRPGRLE